MLPYLALALYIVSLIASLILMLTTKRKDLKHRDSSLRPFKSAMIVHFFFLLLFFIAHLINRNHNNAFSFLSFSFLFYFCSGTALCGWAVRTTVPLLVKIYFMLFDASLVLFVLMPFNFSIFLLSGSLTDTNEMKFPVNDRYYIMEQGSVMKQAGVPVYRVVKHNGMFNQTVQYNLSFGGVLDSIHVINVINDKSALIRAYFKDDAKQDHSDSSDVEVKLKHEVKNEIQRQI